MLLGVVIGLIVLQLQKANCQDGGPLPDSILPNIESNCAVQQALDPTVCCETIELVPTRFFCTIQCINSEICRCVDRITGEPIEGLPTFPENDQDGIDCTAVFSTTDPPTTPSPTETTETSTSAETTASPTTAVSSESPTTELITSDMSTASPDPMTSESLVTSAPVTSESPETSEAVSTSTIETEEPTDDICDDDDDSSSSTGRGSSQSSKKSKRSSGSSSRSYSSTDCSSNSKSRDSSTSRSSGTSGSSSTSRSSGTSGSSSTSRSSGTSGSSSSSSRSSSHSSGSSSRSSGSSSSGTSRSKKCTRVVELLRDGCLPSCLQLDSRKCPVCRESCTSSPGFLSDCICTNPNQVCIRGGLFGLYTCVDRPGLGEMCQLAEEDEEDTGERYSTPLYRRLRRVGRRIVGIKEKIIYGRLGRQVLECQNGTVCMEGSSGTSTCQAENPSSACITARMQDPSITCTSNGEFELLQCMETGPIFECRCVRPDTGEEVSNTRVIVADIADVPNCEALVFRSCTSQAGGVTVGVNHGDTLVDQDQCRMCTCNNGELVNCQTPQNCARITRTLSSCLYKNRAIRHADQFTDDDNNNCVCYNGRIRCSRQNSDIRDQCSLCRKERYSPVSGTNGVTYYSRCVAVYCEGQIPFKLFPGSFINNDICSRYPCGENETCVRRGGVNCIRDCKGEDLRICVNVAELTCPSIEENDTSVCATNGVTYNSLCRLLQDSKGESIAYVGECGSTSCSGGQVCGTDGETYDNICALRSRVGNVRLDYRGECLNKEGATVEETCNEVLSERRCQFNATNCRSLVEPRDGCCPICGGLVTIVLDRLSLQEYSKINSQISNFDSVFERIVDSGVFPKETSTRCGIEFTIVNRNIQLILSSKTSADAEFCQEEAERITGVLNEPEKHLTFLPDVMQFARAAVASSQQVTQEAQDESSSNNGAISLSVASASLLMTFIGVFM